MQTQPGTARPEKRGDSQRARQAANLSEDVFKGGANGRLSAALNLKSPWNAGMARLWTMSRRRSPEA